ncbi:MAG: hypothetical protein IRY84_06860 [Thermobispora bispora]|uniref:hypothetical protein n=1 Tax=Thermobispora bispora TaxID=2006 RepID=UPI00197D2168|nr:hypothetical protein [Thermobispora bispora]MBO2473227.1 hypothetical protein [Actinomycetales bacterium]MBX6167340.1 hypothetical protein [Thermobispora bispora]MDI9580040.1 hypothetical protein [Thermobispora sp.]QSI46608.1 hypothetical protein CYL17_01095 [Thermobispora bispora]
MIPQPAAGERRREPIRGSVALVAIENARERPRPTRHGPPGRDGTAPEHRARLRRTAGGLVVRYLRGDRDAA